MAMFVLGAFVGCTIGVVLMCVLISGRCSECALELERWKRIQV